jgi:hypothetical protein
MERFVMDVKLAVGKVRKAIVAAVAVAVAGVLNNVVHLDVAAVEVLVDALIVSGLVWFVPNAKDVLEDA